MSYELRERGSVVYGGDVAGGEILHKLTLFPQLKIKFGPNGFLLRNDNITSLQ